MCGPARYGTTGLSTSWASLFESGRTVPGTGIAQKLGRVSTTETQGVGPDAICSFWMAKPSFVVRNAISIFSAGYAGFLGSPLSALTSSTLPHFNHRGAGCVTKILLPRQQSHPVIPVQAAGRRSNCFPSPHSSLHSVSFGGRSL